MSILLRPEIMKAMTRRAVGERLIVSPLLDSDRQIGKGSIDLRLGTEFIEIERRIATVIDPLHLRVSQIWPRDPVFVSLGDSFVLHPGQFVLGGTLEFVHVPFDIAGQVLGRSSWGRLGLSVATAVVVQPGFKGVLTLELSNSGSVPILLYPGLRVAQLQLFQADVAYQPSEPLSNPYTVPLGPESVHLAWEESEVEGIRRCRDRFAGGKSRPPELGSAS
jgi:dCTP deaminase